MKIPNTQAQDKFKLFTAGLAQKLKTHKFSRKGNWWYFIKASNCVAVMLQKSQDSTRVSIKFTINCYAYFGDVHGIETFCPEFLTRMNSDLQFRLGYFLPAYQDLWWTIYTYTEIQPVLDEIWSMLESKAIPHLLGFLSSEFAIKHLETPGCAHINEHLRVDYLNVLKAKHANKSPSV
jgi:hypothetical protein